MNQNDPISSLALTLVGTFVTGGIGLFYWAIKKYLTDISKKLGDLQEKEAANTVALTRIDARTEAQGKDIARVEGAIETMRKTQAETAEKVVKATSRLDAAFRYIDGAGKRASDIG